MQLKTFFHDFIIYKILIQKKLKNFYVFEFDPGSR